MAYNGKHLAKLDDLKALGTKQKEVADALAARVDTLENVGSQANVLEGVKVNGTALSIANKMVDILIATGSKNGSISVNGADVAIKGLAALAFKAKVSQSDLDEALAAILDGKADKATTLDGYGITNAYTKDEINAKISAVYKPAGAVAFAELPSLSESILGNVYNVTDAFTTTANFVEGAGNKYPKGTNVVVVKVGDAYKYDVLAGFVDLSGYVEKEAGKGLSDENFTAALKDKLDGIAAGANKYVHPTHTAAASGLYKTTVDEEGHVTATTPVTKDDITNLGIPAKDTTYGKATAAADGLMAAADKSKLDGMSIATDSEVSEMLAEVYGEYVHTHGSRRGCPAASFFREVILLSEKLTTLSQLRAVSQKSKDRAAQVADTAAAALDEMEEVKADKTEFVSFSIPATGWKTDSSVPGYTNYIDIAISGLTAADYVAVDVVPASSAVARAANFVATESRAGILRLRAASVPTAAISAQYHIITAATAAKEG